ncbi:hypothetical protein ACWKWW_01815 [Chryseobacterium cucumeris]|uniref:hypothetical protein n=1 Tax=Chryseobacterium cucumeris TaxID=1813611 RepID=UPI003D958854
MLKFEKNYDPDLFRACIDLLEDSQYAIDKVFKNGLITESNSHGEQYLRLYGVLNAYYIQLGVITDLVRLFDLDGQKQIRTDLKSAKIIELRNKLGAHTTSYLHPGEEEEPNFYRIDLLPEERKRVFLPCKIERKSYPELSRLWEISEAAVNGHNARQSFPSG